MNSSLLIPKKTLWRFAILFALAFLMLFSLSKFVDPYCNLDSSYYHVMASQLDKGKGFTEPVIWQHLNHYDSLEHPMDYWMPLGIIAYHLARHITGVNNEICINLFLWSLLAILVFNETYKFTNSSLFAGLSFFMFIFHGRNLCYLLTTDNCAFSATIGFFLIKIISEKNDSWKITAIISGINSLLRIEGLLFAFFTGLLEYRKNRSIKILLLFFILATIIISPWIARNLVTLGKPWTSNTKALFLQSYRDFFDDKFSGDLNSFLNQGIFQIGLQRLSGLTNSLVDLVILPSQLVLFPFILTGVIVAWNKFGQYFTAFLIFSISICGILFPIQTKFGTAMHISSMFYPFYAILTAIGFHFLAYRYNFSSKFKTILVCVIAVWSIIISTTFLERFISAAEEQDNPYKELFASLELKKTDKIVSHRPVLVFRLSGCNGVFGSNITTSSPAEIAEKYDCNILITDLRNLHPQKINKKKWELINIQPLLRVYKRS